MIRLSPWDALVRRSWLSSREHWLRQARYLAKGKGPDRQDLAMVAAITRIEALGLEEARLLTAARSLYDQNLIAAVALADHAQRRRYRYLDGDLSRRLGQSARARERFDAVVGGGADDRLGRAAQRLLDVLDTGR